MGIVCGPVCWDWATICVSPLSLLPLCGANAQTKVTTSSRHYPPTHRTRTTNRDSPAQLDNLGNGASPSSSECLIPSLDHPAAAGAATGLSSRVETETRLADFLGRPFNEAEQVHRTCQLTPPTTQIQGREPSRVLSSLSSPPFRPSFFFLRSFASTSFHVHRLVNNYSLLHFHP